MYACKYAPYIKQDIERFEAGKSWVGDHAQHDVWCWCGNLLVRLWLTSWLDWRTDKLTGWMLSPEPNSATILAAFGHGIRDKSNMGGPADAIIDNGKHYDGYTWDGQTKQQRLRRFVNAGDGDESTFNGLFGLLNIEPHYTTPYNPAGKAPQERFYRTVHEQFDKTFPTYCGSTPQDRATNGVRGRRTVSGTFDSLTKLPKDWPTAGLKECLMRAHKSATLNRKKSRF